MSCKELFLDHIASYNIHPTCLMSGSIDSELVFIGEYPGVKEATTGIPFSGGAGELLWNALRKHKIYRPHVYATNVVKRQVTAKSGVQAHELSLWQEALHYELSLLTNVKVIICLGNTAMNTLLNFTKITAHRGSVYEYNDIPVVVLNNPALSLRKPETEIIFSMDIEKVMAVYNGLYKPHKIKAYINPTFAEAMSFMRAVRKRFKKFSMDIEVTGYETACIGIGISAHTAMCINLRDAKTSRYTVEEEFRLLRMFAALCDQEDTFCIAQNGNFDSYFMGFKDHLTFKVDFDTLLAHHTLYPRLPHNLGFLTSQYTNHPYYKDDIDIFKEGGNIDTFWVYNCTDCCITFAVYEKEHQELVDQKLDIFFYSHVMRLQPHLSLSTTTGVAVDVVRKEELNIALTIDVEKLRQSVVKAAQVASRNPTFTLNPNSAPQKAKLLFDVLKVKYHRRSTDKKALEDITKDPRTNIDTKEFIAKLGQYTTEQKFFSTYVKTKLDEDNRFRAEFKQFGVTRAPGRLSSSKTLWGSGCVPMEDKYKALTPKGWVSITEKPPIIAQYNDCGVLSFVSVQNWNTFDYASTMHCYTGRNIKGMFTPEHTMVCKKRDNLYTKPVVDAVNTSFLTVPVSGIMYEGIKCDHDWIRTLVMISADGHQRSHGNWCIRLKKERKIQRVEQLLSRTMHCVCDGKYKSLEQIEDECFTKTFPNVMLWNFEARKVFLDELKYWDASIRKKSFVYYTTIEANAYLVQDVCHITNMSATVSVDYDNGNKYGNTSTKPLYRVFVSPKNTNSIERKRWTEQYYEGVVGCPTVNSGMWLMKCNHHIHVTGNSNAQNQPYRAWEMYLADNGCVVIYFDLAQAEARYVAWDANIEQWKSDFERARLEGGYDAHRALASEMFNIAYDDVPLKDHDEHGNFTKRYIAKRCRHGLNYRMHIARLAETTGMSYSMAASNYYKYHKITPELQRWWYDVEREIKRTRTLFNSYGRRFIAMERLDKSDIMDSIIAFKPQSTIGDKTQRVWYQCHEDDKWNSKKARIALNVHDALYGIATPDFAMTALAIMKKYAEEPIMVKETKSGKINPMIVPADCKMSFPDEYGFHRMSNLKEVTL